MSIKNIFDGFRDRTSWPTMMSLLTAYNLPISRGWSQTLQKLIEYEKENLDKAEYIDSINKLELSLKEYSVVGNKSVRVFNIENDNIIKAINSLKSYNIPHTKYHEKYPYPIDQDALKEVNTLPKLVDILDISNGCVAVIFCTKRHITVKNVLDPNDCPTEVREFLEDFDEVVTQKKFTRQLFDAVILHPGKNIAEVRIEIMDGLSSLDRQISFAQIIKVFNELVNLVCSFKIFLNDEVNFFPLLTSLYDSQEGKVGEISFTTDEGSIKHEKMRRTDFDLRNETYHKAGKQAVCDQDQQINIYRIAILWKFTFGENIETQLELLVPGQVQMLHQDFPVLKEVIIKKCGVIEEYDFVFSKVMYYLDNG